MINDILYVRMMMMMMIIIIIHGVKDKLPSVLLNRNGQLLCKLGQSLIA